MTDELPISTESKGTIWLGRVLSAVPVLLLLFSGTMKLIQPEGFAENVEKMGIPPHLAFGIGITEIVCAILYVIPQTAVLGAILLTGYLGGAVITHLRLEDPMFFMPALVGVVIWLGLYCRDRRIRELAPLRRLRS
jgi:uncharacterized membrane protein YphA (DoxX/SURF4 family)